MLFAYIGIHGFGVVCIYVRTLDFPKLRVLKHFVSNSMSFLESARDIIHFKFQLVL
jgi:hypothetical protein